MSQFFTQPDEPFHPDNVTFPRLLHDAVEVMRGECLVVLLEQYPQFREFRTKSITRSQKTESPTPRTEERTPREIMEDAHFRAGEYSTRFMEQFAERRRGAGAAARGAV